MNTAQKLMHGIIRNKLEHIENFLDDEDIHAAKITVIECQDLMEIDMSNMQINTKAQERAMFDMITMQPDKFIEQYK